MRRKEYLPDLHEAPLAQGDPLAFCLEGKGHRWVAPKFGSDAQCSRCQKVKPMFFLGGAASVLALARGLLEDEATTKAEALAVLDSLEAAT